MLRVTTQLQLINISYIIYLFKISFILQNVYYYDRQKIYVSSKVLCSTVAQDFVLLGYDGKSQVNHITKSRRMILP